ncbi:anthranilate phosphoribosyltransferase [Schlesneria sp.]|uniref:anthranilate phosphoribosyltransferase n=1 Tax=Schlesneria sp. TaxID=2762018 RepID=UPI002EDD1017
MHDALKPAFAELLDGRPLPAELMKAAVDAIMDGECSEAEVAAFLTALRLRGESVGELVGAALAMRERSTTIHCQAEGLLDTCGTGGDQLSTFNISTAAALVAAAAGQPVAKHGNRGATSKSGSADVLEALGVNLQLSAEQVGRCIDEVGIGFCFAPLLHSAMKHVGPVRKQLGFRTIFNLLGPLTNPARASYQLLGATKKSFAEKLAQALFKLGTQRALVVCGNDELDEVSLWGSTTVFEVTPTEVISHLWTAETLGLPECHVEALRVDNAAESADVIRRVFAGERGPAYDMVVANAGAALLAAGKTASIQAAVILAKDVVDSGAARDLCERLTQWTNR